MKALLSLAMLFAFGVGIVGCHADANVDGNDTSSTGGSSYKKTTTVEHPNGTTEKNTTYRSSNP